MFKEPFKLRRLEENEFVEYTFLSEQEFVDTAINWIQAYIKQNKIYSSHDPSLRDYISDIKSSYLKHKRDKYMVEGSEELDIPLYRGIRKYIEDIKPSM